MTEFQLLLRAIEARGRGAARAATVRASDAVHAAAVADLPRLGVVREGDDIVLRAPGLRARAFGSRRAAADPRLSGLLQAAVR